MMRTGAQELLGLLEEGKIRPAIGRTLDEAALAQQHREGREQGGKCCSFPEERASPSATEETRR